MKDLFQEIYSLAEKEKEKFNEARKRAIISVLKSWGIDDYGHEAILSPVQINNITCFKYCNLFITGVNTDKKMLEVVWDTPFGSKSKDNVRRWVDINGFANAIREHEEANAPIIVYKWFRPVTTNREYISWDY